MAKDKTTIEELHNEVLDYLIEKRKEYPDLCFTLRGTNENGRLARGYWFWGNEEQLYFSFWNGNDWKVSAPNISITINLEGKMLIYLNGRDSDKKADFFMELVILLGRFQRNKNKETGVFENQWLRKYTLKTENWKNALDDFLSQKKQIDMLLEFYGGNIDGLSFLDKYSFERQLKAVLSAQNKLAKASKTKVFTELAEVGKPLKLQSVKLENIGHFERVEIDLSKQITVLIGENGSGKSTVLKAIALGLSGVADPVLCSKYLRILETNEVGEEIFAKSGAIELAYKLNKQQTTAISFESTTLGGVTTSVNVGTEDDWLLAGKNYFIDLILGFPQGKKRPNIKLPAVPEPNINDLIDLIEDRDTQHFQDMVDWIINLYREPEPNKRNENLEKINTVFQILSNIISDEENPKAILLKTAVHDVERGIKQVIICTPDAPNGISLDLVSQGYTNIFVWVGWLVRRLYSTLEVHKTYNKKPEELAGKFINDSQKRGERHEANTIKDLHGVILLDEIDTYLHPKWQRNILTVLAVEFPKLQFIVTTHSPLVLSHLEKWYNTHVYQITKLKAEKLAYFYGRNHIDTFWEFYGIEARPQKIQAQIDKLYTLFDDDKYEEARVILEELKEILGTNDPITAELATSLEILETVQ